MFSEITAEAVYGRADLAGKKVRTMRQHGCVLSNDVEWEHLIGQQWFE